jgi:hypothetical protein
MSAVESEEIKRKVCNEDVIDENRHDCCMGTFIATSCSIM